MQHCVTLINTNVTFLASLCYSKLFACQQNAFTFIDVLKVIVFFKHAGYFTHF
jgi:hypothetical protein